jgi:hypothetical protein
MMKIALAVQNGAICPRLDCARHLIVLDVLGSAVRSREVLDITAWPARGRANRLAALGIETFVCGMLCKFDEAGFDGSGVRLVQDVSGPIDRVIKAICRGKIEPGHDYWPRGFAPDVSNTTARIPGSGRQATSDCCDIR